MDAPTSTHYPPSQAVPYPNYPTDPPNYSGYTPQGMVVQQNTPTKAIGERSCLLIGFGITLIVFSLMAIIVTIICISIIGGPLYLHTFAFAANILFLTKGMLSIAGGCNLRTREQTNIISIIVGVVAFFLTAASIVAGPIFMIADERFYESLSPNALAVYIATIINALFGLILSICTCCQVCPCCDGYKKRNNVYNGTAVIQQPPKY